MFLILTFIVKFLFLNINILILKLIYLRHVFLRGFKKT